MRDNTERKYKVVPKKGQKNLRDVAEGWDGERKTENLTVGMTATGKQGIKDLAASMGLSVSELLERLARGLLVVREKED